MKKEIGKFLEENKCFELEKDFDYVCVLCSTHIKYDPRQGSKVFKKHIKSKKHSEMIRIEKEGENIEKKQFHCDFVKMLVKTNISFNAIDNEYFKGFFEKYTKCSLKSRATYLSKILPDTFQCDFAAVIESFKGKPFYIMADETPDFMGRKLINILAGTLCEEAYSLPKLINTLEVERLDGDSLANIISFEVNRLVCSAEEYSNFRLFLTDAAPYCIKAGKILAGMFSSLKHVTCLVHALHNLAETVRVMCPNVNKCIALLTKHFSKKNKLGKLFKSSMVESMPDFPVLTRWGTWITFSKFLYNNFQAIQTFLENEKNSFNFIDLLVVLEDASINTEFMLLRTFFDLPIAIKNLEKSNLTVYESIEIFNSVQDLTKNEKLLSRIKDIKSRNPNLEFFEKFNILKCKVTDRCLLNAPLTTVSVERSFSQLRHVLGHLKTKMCIETLKMCIFYYFNK